MTDSFDLAKDFLQRNFAKSLPPPDNRPTVTLTFAQSLDGKISRPGQQLLLSGKESMAMTHRLRATHDGILVGIGTVLCDNPRLNARLLPAPECHLVEQPQPIVLDTHLRFPPTANLLAGPKENHRLKLPWIVCGPVYDAGMRARLEAAGARVIVIDKIDGAGHPVLAAVLKEIFNLGISSLMVEGGAQIIQLFMTSRLTDRLITTTAPVLVGSGGVPAVAAETIDSSFAIEPLEYAAFGRDIVMFATTAAQ
ncbi:2,5-diamino-6-(ribosylamino)-4(3H)-pyrimidinone 5'-phosphate reductase [Linderina pennispora]|nr:2,5-diamino-6-(ribosylamino)-4(3H)-pyrimidinone 5'-phosphate reductase [Linderina pennispora]